MTSRTRRYYTGLITSAWLVALVVGGQAVINPVKIFFR
jgi:hypothetical protein